MIRASGRARPYREPLRVAPARLRELDRDALDAQIARDRDRAALGCVSLATRTQRMLGLRGFSGSGKTTLLVELIPALVARGLTISTVKRAHHGFDVDKPGKDSHRHREAGATEVMITSGARFALLHELRGKEEPRLEDLLERMSPVDLVLVEGFREEPHPKIEIWRSANNQPLIGTADPHVLAIATPDLDAPELATQAQGLPILDLNDPEAIATFIHDRLFVAK